MFCLFAAGIGAASNGFYTSMVSIAPPFVGILSSISKMFALLGMLATPYIVTIFRKQVRVGVFKRNKSMSKNLVFEGKIVFVKIKVFYRLKTRF